MKKCEEIATPAPKPKSLQTRANEAWKEWKEARGKGKKKPLTNRQRKRKGLAKKPTKAQKRQLRTGHMTYHEYIASPDWRRFVAKLKKERGSVCEVCRRAGPVDAHHKTYKRLKNEHRGDIQLLCRECHAIQHEDKHFNIESPLYREFAAIVNGG